MDYRILSRDILANCSAEPRRRLVDTLCGILLTLLILSGSGLAVAASDGWKSVKVKRGDNLTLIFKRMGLDQGQLNSIISQGGAAKNLARLKPGDILEMRIHPKGELQELSYQVSPIHRITAKRSGDGFGVNSVTRVPERRTAHASATITDSLFVAAEKAGLSQNKTMELANLFGWDIDFALDIRQGDNFTVLYEDLYLDGKKIGEGHILAAEFVNRGNAYRALRYTNANGDSEYFTPEGGSVRKAFLRTPVNFTRISSRFSSGRWHPILNKWRAHKGVDYAAPSGTPVKSAGTGKVAFRGRKRGYGNVLIIQHGGKYQTVYGHLSRFARGIRSGSRVKQGQTVAYVGQTGVATGPHLHYEFRVNGVHRNPLTVKLPIAKPIAAKFRDDFKDKAASLVAQLELVRHTSVAQAESANQPVN